MKLSIVTINYNNAEGLRKTLASVAAQTYHDIEHIIVDAASTDGSVDVIREYEQTLTAHHSPLTVIWSSEKDKGIYDGMNKGIEIALGRRVVNENHQSQTTNHKSSQFCDSYVWILNSGDCAASQDVIERMVDAIEYHKSQKTNHKSNKIDIPILLGNIVRVYPGNKRQYSPLPVERKLAKHPIPMDVSMLTFYRGTVPQDAAFVRRDLFEKYGYFDETMKICADWKLYLNMIALDGIVPMYVNIDVVLFDMTGVSNANDALRLAERRAYLEQVLPESVLKDYDAYHFPIEEYNRLKKYHLWGLVYFIERVLFKLEKWHILK